MNRLVTLLVVFCSIVNSSFCEEKKDSKWSLLSGYEATYTGNNAVLHAAYISRDNHVLEAGLNYNFSDGFASNPVIGFGMSYGYNILNYSKWQTSIGADYRRQKPVDIVNIQTLMYTTKVQFNWHPRWSIYTRIGYGVAVERARSSGSFTQQNSVSGSFSTGCAYRL